ncbi:PIN-like domain-containing protein [Halomonas sp. LY9]
MRQFKGRAWITYHAAEEYLRNRASVIAEQETHYTEVIKKIDGFVSDFKEVIEKNRQHPFISEKSSTEFFTAADKIKEELKESGEKYFSRVGDDEIRKEVVEIFDGQIGKPFNEGELNEIFDKGIARYKNKVPPGYEDITKYKGAIDDEGMALEDKKRVFGDLIIWEEIIKKSKEDQKDIILVTGDVKEDWWSKSKGKNLGPRVELIKEFEEETGQKFYMYTSYRFLVYSSSDKDSESVKSAVEEIKKTNSINNASLLKGMVAGEFESKYLQFKDVSDHHYFSQIVDSVVKSNKKEESLSLDSKKVISSLSEDFYLLGKEINDLRKKISIIDNEIHRYSVKLAEIDEVDELIGVDNENNESYVEMRRALKAFVEIREKLNMKLARKSMQLESLENNFED